MALLTGCAEVTSSTCPPLIKYTAAQQAAVADELDAHSGEIPATAGMVDDYGKTRDAIRICRGGAK